MMEGKSVDIIVFYVIGPATVTNYQGFSSFFSPCTLSSLTLIFDLKVILGCFRPKPCRNVVVGMMSLPEFSVSNNHNYFIIHRYIFTYMYIHTYVHY